MNKKFLITAISVAFAGFLTFGTAELKAGEVNVEKEITLSDENKTDENKTDENKKEEIVNETAVIGEGVSGTEEASRESETASEMPADASAEEVTGEADFEKDKENVTEEEKAEDDTSEDKRLKEESAEKKVLRKKDEKKNRDKSVKVLKKSIKVRELKTAGGQITNRKAETSKTVIKLTDEEFKMLACTIFVEGGNQPFSGKVAIANVVINRVKSGLFPNSVTNVLHQKTYGRGRVFYQFAIVKPGGTLSRAMAVYGRRPKGSWQAKAEAECIRAAKAALNGQKSIRDNHFFFMVSNHWIKSSRPNGIQIAAHYFYR